MPLFAKKEVEVVLCSPIEGHITFKGVPIADAKLVRQIVWKDKLGETDTVYTDKNGLFKFPLKKENIKLSPLIQFVSHQKIDVEYQDTVYRIWVMGKLDKDLYSELGGVPVNFRCELTDELVRVETESGLLGTSCKWDNIEQKEFEE